MRLLMLVVVAVALFCLVRGIIDLWHGQYVWGVTSILCAALLALTPIRSRAVKYDLPRP